MKLTHQRFLPFLHLEIHKHLPSAPTHRDIQPCEDEGHENTLALRNVSIWRGTKLYEIKSTDCHGGGSWCVEKAFITILFLLLFGADPILHGPQLLCNRLLQRGVQLQHLCKICSCLMLIPHRGMGLSSLVESLYIVCERVKEHSE